MRAYIFFVSGPKFTKFLCAMGVESSLITPFTAVNISMHSRDIRG